MLGMEKCIKQSLLYLRQILIDIKLIRVSVFSVNLVNKTMILWENVLFPILIVYLLFGNWFAFLDKEIIL
jgi:hypothetical protein